jgi:hypothetical protein
MHAVHPSPLRLEGVLFSVVYRYLMSDGDDWLSSTFKTLMTPFTLTPVQVGCCRAFQLHSNAPTACDRNTPQGTHQCSSRAQC